MLVGKKTGTNELPHKLKCLGIDAEDHLLKELLKIVKKESSRIKISLTDEELLHLHPTGSYRKAIVSLFIFISCLCHFFHVMTLVRRDILDRRYRGWMSLRSSSSKGPGGPKKLRFYRTCCPGQLFP